MSWAIARFLPLYIFRPNSERTNSFFSHTNSKNSQEKNFYYIYNKLLNLIHTSRMHTKKTVRSFAVRIVINRTCLKKYDEMGVSRTMGRNETFVETIET